jgi:zinc-binding alcohol dehydrogenase family protein
MKAVGLYRGLPIADEQALIDVEVQPPQASGRDVLVQVKAVSVNPVDYKVRASAAATESPKIIGYDAAGVVIAVGPDVQFFKPGDEVYYAGDITRAGTNSELHLVDERIVGRKPRNLSFAEAAAMPLTTLTAWEALYDRLEVPAGSGKSILIIGGAGGVGSIAIQLARRLGLVVAATASRPDSRAWVKELGAEHIIDHRQPIAPQLRSVHLTEVDYVLCLTDYAPYFDQFANLLKPQGKLCLIVSNSMQVNLNALMQKSITVCWELMFTRPIFRTEDLGRQREILNEAAGLFESGELRTTLREHFGSITAKNLKRAHQQLESGTTIGKIALEGWQ